MNGLIRRRSLLSILVALASSSPVFGGSYEQALRVHSLDMLKRLCPEIDELQSLDALGRKLHQQGQLGKVQK